MTVLVTGAAGFIGYHVAGALLAQGEAVVGLDNFNAYYDVGLKEARAARLREHAGFTEVRMDLTETDRVLAVMAEHRPRLVVHLAAQAGVRYSLENPRAYVDSNLLGFFTILEAARLHRPEHVVFASTSSVYGANTVQPFSPHHGADHPMTLYAATKRANEAMAHSYAHLYGVPMTGLRFFTVYGPWGRPDMALFKFTRAMLAGEPITVFNNGQMARDFTYIDDIVTGILGVAAHPPAPRPETAGSTEVPQPLDPACSPVAPFAVHNIGNGQPVPLMDYIAELEAALGVEAIKEMLPMQPGDVPGTWADVSDLSDAIGYAPSTPVAVGVRRFVEWYLSFYGDPRAAG
ncbi:NAD-dependent epimerase [Roseospira marina]|uniref:NAD-dependent epimerase n=1 Tax=Roseospira marina TaxID=140057 RepID=A0A5M6IHL9_9PROT|nr:NAD-dependent epimerase [Roseospira marina]KAA5607662.1 NAD-dependent epimerase [Roseospira marina]MBB4312135.1 UDP-glucuronate 4-epimerase [Roseospira marina]MBB5085849.1 UDP-glucuronate 4-epimerase [Roseospira marina]